MKQILAGALSLGLGLVGLSGIASAQTPAGISTNADGSYVASRAGVNPTADGGGGTVIYGDITTGPGYHVIGVTADDPAPVPGDSAPVAASEETLDPAETSYAPEPPTGSGGTGSEARDTDADADNIADTLEWNLGLDPGNADTDADGVADGDEISLYGPDPLSRDSDDDGMSDGEELFGIKTDPLIWNAPEAQPDQTLAQDIAQTPENTQFEQATVTTVTEPVDLAQNATQKVTAVDGDAATMGNGDASAAPGSISRPGNATITWPDNSRVVSEAPSNVTVTGDIDVIAPLDESSNANLVSAAGTSISCGAIADWYDVQIAYENAGATAADPAVVQALDPDYDGIACEEGMA